jgi:ABC-type nitrate/sulfonate/bicarbonate transport system permease component
MGAEGEAMTAVAMDAKTVTAPRREREGSDLARRAAKGLLSTAISIGVVIGAWLLFLRYAPVPEFMKKGPDDVWRYLFTEPDASANRSAVWAESKTTLRDAWLGLFAGTVAAVVASIAFTMSRTIERTFMPLAMVLPSVPLVATTPLIVLVFGRDLQTITVIAGIVTFFPTLVNVTIALKSTPKESIDLLRAYGASPLRTLFKVQVPSALPALFASLRVAAPLALIGALLAEWLATGDGLGYTLLRASSLFDYNGLWARVVLVTVYSILLYKLVGVIERLVMDRFGAVAPKR